MFSDLDECTEYEVQLVTICQNKLSEAGVILFKTDCAPLFPSQGNDPTNDGILNPFSDVPTLEILGNQASDAQLRIYDINGRVLADRALRIQYGPNRSSSMTCKDQSRECTSCRSSKRQDR